MKFRRDELPWTACEKFLKGICGRVMGSQRLLKAMKKHTGMSKEELKDRLEWGTPKPRIFIDILDGANGEYRGGSTIYVDLDIALALEFGHEKATKREVELVMESTLLHEFVHYARKKESGSARHVAKRGGKKLEAGKSFECEAYGGDITMLDSGLKLTRKNIRGGDRYDKFQCRTKPETRIEAILKKTKSKKKTRKKK